MCSDTANVTPRRSSASLRIAGARPTVDTVTARAEIPNPSGAGAVIRRTAASTLEKLASGSPMPMNTTLDNRSLPGPSAGMSRNVTAAARTCSRISAVLRLRVSPPWPVAQNGQAIPQPAWEETQTVLRSG